MLPAADRVALFRRLALEAGAQIMQVYDSADMGVESKADDSPVTRADQLADDVISAGLRAQMPDIALVTEEQRPRPMVRPPRPS